MGSLCGAHPQAHGSREQDRACREEGYSGRKGGLEGGRADGRRPSDRKTEGFHIAPRAHITAAHPVACATTTPTSARMSNSRQAAQGTEERLGQRKNCEMGERRHGDGVFPAGYFPRLPDRGEVGGLQAVPVGDDGDLQRVHDGPDLLPARAVAPCAVADLAPVHGERVDAAALHAPRELDRLGAGRQQADLAADAIGKVPVQAPREASGVSPSVISTRSVCRL